MLRSACSKILKGIASREIYNPLYISKANVTKQPYDHEETDEEFDIRYHHVNLSISLNSAFSCAFANLKQCSRSSSSP